MESRFFAIYRVIEKQEINLKIILTFLIAKLTREDNLL